MIQTHNLRRLARSTIVLALLDYAKAHKTLTASASSVSAKERSAQTQREISEFFADTENPLFGFAEMDGERMLERFLAMAADPERMVAVAKLKYAD